MIRPMIAKAEPARISATVRGSRLAKKTSASSSATPMNSEIVASAATAAAPATIQSVGEERVRGPLPRLGGWTGASGGQLVVHGREDVLDGREAVDDDVQLAGGSRTMLPSFAAVVCATSSLSRVASAVELSPVAAPRSKAMIQSGSAERMNSLVTVSPCGEPSAPGSSAAATAGVAELVEEVAEAGPLAEGAVLPARHRQDEGAAGGLVRDRGCQLVDAGDLVGHLVLRAEDLAQLLGALDAGGGAKAPA